MDRPRNRRWSCNCGGNWSPGLLGSAKEVSEPGRRYHPCPFRFFTFPGQASRSDPRKAHDPGPSFCFAKSSIVCLQFDTVCEMGIF